MSIPHLPGTLLTESEALDWGKYLAIDPDGSARVFKHEPIKVGGRWVPDKFPGKMAPACYPVDEEYEDHLEGRLLERKISGGDRFYVKVDKTSEKIYRGGWV